MKSRSYLFTSLLFAGLAAAAAQALGVPVVRLRRYVYALASLATFALLRERAVPQVGPAHGLSDSLQRLAATWRRRSSRICLPPQPLTACSQVTARQPCSTTSSTTARRSPVC